jgi:hypothetical protein
MDKWNTPENREYRTQMFRERMQDAEELFAAERLLSMADLLTWYGCTYNDESMYRLADRLEAAANRAADRVPPMMGQYVALIIPRHKRDAWEAIKYVGALR